MAVLPFLREGKEPTDEQMRRASEERPTDSLSKRRKQEIRRALGDCQNCGLRVPRDGRRHYGRVHDPQPADAHHTQFRIDDRHLVRAHAAGTHRVVRRSGMFPNMLRQRPIGG